MKKWQNIQLSPFRAVPPVLFPTSFGIFPLFIGQIVVLEHSWLVGCYSPWKCFAFWEGNIEFPFLELFFPMHTHWSFRLTLLVCWFMTSFTKTVKTCTLWVCKLPVLLIIVHWLIICVEWWKMLSEFCSYLCGICRRLHSPVQYFSL